VARGTSATTRAASTDATATTLRLAWDMNRRVRVAGLAAAVAALHLAGWGALGIVARDHPAFAGLGALAYALGLRHAFDVDHLAAIDNTTRNLLARGRSALGVGFCFSLGHSSVVVALVAAVALFGTSAHALGHLGGPLGAGISGGFLLLIGLLNLAVLLDVLGAGRDLRAGRIGHADVERRLNERGLVTRLGLARLFRLVGRSWHVLPIGFLFALGFDTASEIALLAVAAGASGGSLPRYAPPVLPILFSAGMVLLDTADGLLMSFAYGWASGDPARRLRTNGILTGLSVAVALAAGEYQLFRAGPPLLTYSLLVLLTLAAATVATRALRAQPELQSSRSTG
jgi:nickel/cobalt transporter (NiCoT) family protein